MLRIDTQIEERFRRVAKRRCIEIAEEVVRFIRTSPATPVMSGELKEGYYVRETARGAAIDNVTDYWRYVEFGTAEHGAAQPHVRPAIEAVLLRNLNTLRPRKGR